MLQESPNYELHHTQRLEEHVKDYLSLWSEDYAPYTKNLPLTNVLWCTGGLYRNQCLGYSIPYREQNRWRESVFHEHGHHMEQICPAIGVFTNELLLNRTGGLDRRKLVPVYGGRAMPVKDGLTPWIKPYAGKWYGRLHPELPIITEIISVYSECFRSPDVLIKLMYHDPFMLKFMCFVFMGGPLAYLQSTEIQERNKALQAIKQRRTREMGYETRSSHRRRGGGGGRSSSEGTKTSKKNRRNSFGV